MKKKTAKDVAAAIKKDLENTTCEDGGGEDDIGYHTEKFSALKTKTADQVAAAIQADFQAEA